MQRFKSIILPLQGKNKSSLQWLYNTKWQSNRAFEEKEKIFSYGQLLFWFGGTSLRNSEKLLLYVEFPVSFGEGINETDAVPIENYLLHVLSLKINALAEKYVNEAKNVREKAQFETQRPNELMLRRSGIRYNYEKGAARLTIHFNVPLVNALSVNAKAAVRAVKEILEHIEDAARSIDRDRICEYIVCYHKQEQIREYLKRQNLCAFIANGSILPRENAGTEPMMGAVPFCAPKELEVTVPFEDGTQISGMGIRRGVTVITGGGYSGKSTLLDAIESGIYNHIPGDGREYVISDDSTLKIYAEDGRPVHNLDLSPFFRHLPNKADVSNFSTTHASGSVSQASNIIEAVCGGAKLLLIDEDKSATNFMIRDRNMRKIVKNEPIVPFTDRVRELCQEKHVSTILVIGGSSEYLSCADSVLLMDEYIIKDITNEVKTLELPANAPALAKGDWETDRRLVPEKTSQPFLIFRSVKTENEKKIILDDYSADITLLSSISTGNQMNALALIMERLLTDRESDSARLIDKVTEYTKEIAGGAYEARSLLTDTALRWYEEIRPLDAFCCINRMRGASFSRKGGDAQ